MGRVSCFSPLLIRAQFSAVIVIDGYPSGEGNCTCKRCRRAENLEESTEIAILPQVRDHCCRQAPASFSKLMVAYFVCRSGS